LDAGHIVNKIPRDIDLNTIVYRTADRRLVVTDGQSYSLPINGFGTER